MVNVYEMKLVKVCDGESEDMNILIVELLIIDEGFLFNLVLVLNWSRNLLLFLEVMFFDICNYLFGKVDEYLVENLKFFKSFIGYWLFKDGYVMDLKIYEVLDKLYVLIKFCV